MEILCKVELIESVSSKGNTYEFIQLTFENGYQQRVYLKPAELWAVKSNVR